MTCVKTAIAEVASVNPRLSATDKPEPDDLISFVPMAAVSEKTLAIEDPVDRPYAEVAKGFTTFRRGDILVAKITPCFENGKMAFARDLPREHGVGSTEFHVFRPKDNLDGGYLFHLLRDPYVRKAGEMKMKGAAGQRRVSADFLGSLQIPLPPLAEQKRIAAILDAADALRAKRREALAQLDILLQSTFLDMFGDPVTNPKGWEIRTLEEAATRVTDGTHQSPNWSETGIPFLFVSNIRDRKIDFETSKFISESEWERLTSRCPIEVGDVLYTTVGSYGNPAVVRKGTGKFAFQRHIAHIKPRRDLIDGQFLEVMLDSTVGRKQADRLARGVAQKTLNLRELKSFRILLPPLIEQRHFATIVESIEQQKTRLRNHLTELDTLFASLQQRAFNGDL